MSPIRRHVQEMNPYVPGEQIHEPGWVKLNTNENPYGPSPAVADYLRNVDTDALRRYPEPDCATLRQRIAKLHACRPEQVIAGNGSDELLALCTRALVEDGRAISFFQPSYSLYSVLAEIRAVATRPVALEPDFGWREPDVTDADIFFLTSPNAPTGMAYPREKIEAFCRRFPGVVVIDEAYADFADANCMDLALALPNVLVLRTLSKAYALAAVRFGYMIGSVANIAALFTIKDSYNVNGLTQGIALAALNDQNYTRRSVERIRGTRERLADFLRKREWTVYPSQTNFLWVKPTGMTAHELFLDLRSHRILTRWFDAPDTRNHLRITIGSDEEIDRLMMVIGR